MVVNCVAGAPFLPWRRVTLGVKSFVIGVTGSSWLDPG